MLGSKLRRAVVVLAVLGTVLVVPAAPADAAAACTANVEFNYAPGITVLPGGTFVTGTLVLTCPVLSPDAGMWTLPFAGFVGLESCEGGTGTVGLVPGASGPPGAVAGGFTYLHYWGGALAILGTVTWPGVTRTLVATGEWLPVLVPGDCVLTPVTQGIGTGVAALA